MKRIDSYGVCTFILHILLVFTISIGILSIIAIFCSHEQTECFTEQNEYCVVLSKDTHLRTQVAGKFVTTTSVNRIKAVGLTTQETLTLDVSSRAFNDIEIGDTVKTVKLR